MAKKTENKIINDFQPLIARQKWTSPKIRFSDTSVCSLLDQLSILRPSMANGQITSLLAKRSYITMKKGVIFVTDLGIDVADFLVESEFNFVDPHFTASLESELDAIANGKKDKVEVLKAFWQSLKEGIERGKEVRNKKQETDYECSDCGSPLLLKHSNFGPFFVCSAFKTKGCSYKANVTEDGKPKEKEKKEIVYSDHLCPKCKSKMIERKSKWGTFLGCSKFSKGCRGMRKMDGEEIISKKKKYKK